MGELWEPGTGEKGLRGLVRLTELSGLAGLFVLKEPDAALAAEHKQQLNPRCSDGQFNRNTCSPAYSCQ